MIGSNIKSALEKAGWFQSPGAYVLVDGQFGSTGKGAVAAFLAHLFNDKVNIVTTNAGPNSGHTGFAIKPAQKIGDESGWQYDFGEDQLQRKFVTQQIPVFSVVARALGAYPHTYLNAGAVINPETLRKEFDAYFPHQKLLQLHPNAAVIDADHLTDGADSTDKIASTNKGVGRAIARKVMREDNVVKSRWQDFGYYATQKTVEWDWGKDVVFVETAQGFSLGINQPFYPSTTSRECTVQQAIADANIPYNKVRKVVMSVRTFPIRVGNTAVGQSGDCYPDQKETTWEALGLKPELTTVTKRVRRVFTWSDMQFRAAVAANQPGVLVASFLDYLNTIDECDRFLSHVLGLYQTVMGRNPDAILGGYGPLPTDIRLEA